MPSCPAAREVAVKAGAVAALLDQFELHVAGIRQRDRHIDIVDPSLVAEFAERQPLGIEPGTDAANLHPMPHCRLDIADDDPDLPHRPEQSAHFNAPSENRNSRSPNRGTRYQSWSRVWDHDQDEIM